MSVNLIFLSVNRQRLKRGTLFFFGHAIVLSGLTLSPVVAISVTVPNGSFETPFTTFVNTHVDSWQKTAMPSWYDTNGGFSWDQLAGVFKNTDATSLDHIDNCDGSQAMWMFAVPEIGVFQDYETLDWNDTVPSHDLNVLFEPGKSYNLTVGLIGGGGGMLPGASLELSLYYRDSITNFVPISLTSVTNSPQVFSNNTHFIDFDVRTPAVQAGDAWAWKNIGIRILSTVDTNLQGGYWDIDNVRLATRNPVLANPVWTNGQFEFTLQSEPGLRFQIIASSDLSLPRSNWTNVALVTNSTGSIVYREASSSFSHRFYQAQEVP